MQAELLRVIQHHEFERKGSSHTTKVVVRVIASTVKNLEETERNQPENPSENRWRIEGKGGAAEILGINPSKLRMRMHKLGIRRPREKESN